ncbi:MAG: sulfotransferase [Actinomycetota bacterium]|nr:sulfotransferase [Actinomycetota bacterium]
MPGTDFEPLTPVLIRMLEGRVGSTLLMQLLATSPGVAFERVYPFERSYLTYLVRLAAQVVHVPGAMDLRQMLYEGDRRLGPLPFEAGIIDEPRFQVNILRAMWSAFCSSRRDGDDSAAHPRAEKLYAEKYWGPVKPVLDAGLHPVIVDLVRDPRDVVASIRAFNAKRGQQLFGRSLVLDETGHLRRLVAGMALRLEELQSPAQEAPRLLVRYEDLVSDLAGQAQRLTALLGTELDPSAVVAGRAGMAEHMTADSAEQSVGRWKLDLSSAEVGRIERHLGSRMVELGYEITPREHYMNGGSPTATAPGAGTGPPRRS